MIQKQADRTKQIPPTTELRLPEKRLINRSVIKDFFIYSSGALILKGSHYLLFPFILSQLTTHEFGLLSLINNFITIGSILLGLGLKQVVSIEFFHKNHVGQKELINDVIIFYLTLAIPLIALAIFLISPLKLLLFPTITPLYAVAIAIGTCFITFFTILPNDLSFWRFSR